MTQCWGGSRQYSVQYSSLGTFGSNVASMMRPVSQLTLEPQRSSTPPPPADRPAGKHPELRSHRWFATIKSSPAVAAATCARLHCSDVTALLSG